MKKIFSMYITLVLFLFTTLSLCLFLSFCSSDKEESVSVDTEMTEAQAQEEADVKELKNQIRREKFDLILPLVMRKHNIDMWIHVMRETLPDPLGEEDLGSTSGVFIFTDRGGDRIERAVIGRRWGEGGFWRVSDYKLVEECGAYDIIGEAIDRTERPGGPKTEFDYRFGGVGEFVAERDPKRIALNYLEKLGPHVGSRSRDGISYTDYILLTRALGDKYAKRIVSSEHLMYDYVSRPVKSEIILLKRMRKLVDERLERDLAKIVVPGVTKFTDLEGCKAVVDKNGNRIGAMAHLNPEKSAAAKRSRDYVLQRGDFIWLQHGSQGEEGDLDWKFRNFFDIKDEYAYVLREGETEPPPEIQKAWADVMKVHKILEDNIKVGLTGREIYEILKRKLKGAGFIINDSQQYFKDLDPEKSQVNIDMHAAGRDWDNYNAPRIGSYGPDWHHDMIIPPNHHFFFENFLFIPMPKWGAGKYLMIQLHDGAIVTEHGVEYLSPPPQELHIYR